MYNSDTGLLNSNEDLLNNSSLISFQIEEQANIF